jgi:transcription elongation factor GreA
MILQTHAQQVASHGSRVHIRDIESGEREIYTLTPPGDADIRHDRISTSTPVGRALYGARPGHVVKVHAPGGVYLVKIEAIDQEPNSQFARDG